MYKNQLQELAQRSCFNLPSYTCIREGPDHAPRFKATVTFNGETYECPSYCTTLRQAEHSAAEVALEALSRSGPTSSLAARILDETGVYKNLLQEVSQRVGASLPTYTTFWSGFGHFPAFTGTVEVAGIIFTGEPAKNKKQAEKNAAMAAWSALKILAQQTENSLSRKVKNDEQEHVTVARALQKYRIRAKISNTPFPIRFPMPKTRPTNTTQPPPATTSKILPFLCPKTSPRARPVRPTINNSSICPPNTVPQKFPAAGAAPYIPIRHYGPRAQQGIAPPVTIRNAIPAYSAAPVCIRQVVPVFATPVRSEDSSSLKSLITPTPAQVEDSLPVSRAPITPPVRVDDPPTFKEPIPPAPDRVENPPIFKATMAPGPTRLENLPISKAPIIPPTVEAELLESLVIEDLKELKV